MRRTYVPASVPARDVPRSVTCEVAERVSLRAWIPYGRQDSQIPMVWGAPLFEDGAHVDGFVLPGEPSRGVVLLQGAMIVTGHRDDIAQRANRNV